MTVKHKANITTATDTDFDLAAGGKWRIDIVWVSGTGTATFFWAGTEADGVTALATPIPTPTDVTAPLSLTASTSFILAGNGTFRVTTASVSALNMEVQISPVSR